MNYKENIKNFFIRFKKVIVASSVCVLAIAIIGVVAAKSSSASYLDEATVNTSSPTSISFVMPIENG